MIVADSSLLIVLARLNRFDILGSLFGTVFIPTSVYQEFVAETLFPHHRDLINQAIRAGIIQVREPVGVYQPIRKLGYGEQGVLRLAKDINAKAIILDDKKARNEAKELGFTLIYTSDVLRGAVTRGLIDSYADVIESLKATNIFLPE